MRKAATLVCVVLFGVSLSYGQSRDTGKGQGAIVIRQDAPFYKNSEGPAILGKFDKWEPVGGVQTLARMVESYQFEEEHGRVHVLVLGTSGYSYLGWADPADLSPYFTYECGCGLEDAKCSPHVFVGGVGKKKWNICFQEARDRKLAELKGQPDSAPNANVPSQESPETRLQKLKNLFEKGLISKEEYESKRAEILKAM